MNSDLDQENLIYIYRTLHPKSTEYMFFSAPCHAYSKTDHIIGSKSLLSKCKRMEIITTVSQTTVKSNSNSEFRTNSELHNFMKTEQLVLEC